MILENFKPDCPVRLLCNPVALLWMSFFNPQRPANCAALWQSSLRAWDVMVQMV
jgi:hypothetical protein